MEGALQSQSGAQRVETGHPKKWGMMYVAHQDGKALCSRFSKGGPNACPESCKDGRTHGCQYCLGKHPNSQRTSPLAQQAKEKGGKGAENGKRQDQVGLTLCPVQAPSTAMPSEPAAQKDEVSQLAPQKLAFLDFFAGHAGFSEAVEEVAGMWPK